MGQIGPLQIVIIAAVVILLFGRGKISSLMGDVAKGITSFKKGLKEGEETTTATIDNNGDKVVDSNKDKTTS